MSQRNVLFVVALSVFSSAVGQFAPNYLSGSANGGLESDEVLVDWVGGGAISGDVDGSGDGLGRGAMGIAFYKENAYQGNLIFCLGTTGKADLDSTGTSPGSVLLQPGNGTISFQFDYRSNSLLEKPKWGWSVSFVGASTTWNVNGVSRSAVPLSGRAQVARILFNKTTTKASVYATADLGLSYRGYIGDASASAEFKEQAFGTTTSNFLGVELGFDLKVNDTHLFFNLPVLFGPQVDGLTNGQVVIGLAINGKVLKGIF